MDKSSTTVPANYFKLYFERHIVGFKRVLLSKKEKETAEYLLLGSDHWHRTRIVYDVTIPLSTPPLGVAVLPRK